ncbi:MAG: DoxX family protein [Planctomycetes bacterium]|nr:DoxX family protein [Planctomycetota bacterium]
MDNRSGDATSSVGLLVLRIGVGCYMMAHGWGKAQMVFSGAFDKFPDPISLGSGPSLVLAASAEFLGAALVVIGLGTRFAAASVAFTMAVAAFAIHGKDPWTMPNPLGPSKEPALMFLIPFLALVFTGAGQFSLDNKLRKRRD